ncbi:MAG: hypothetical protein VW618_12285, partial [Alphaproteobacteria bacterium]
IDVADSFGSAGSRFWYAPAALGALTLTLATTALWAASRTPAGVDVANAVIACEPWSPIVARPGRESPALRIDVENGIGPTTVTPQNFRAGLHPLVHARDQLDRLGEGDVLVSAYDLLDARAVGRRMHLLLGEVGSVPVDGRRHLFCVTAQDGGIGMRRIMDVWPID